MKLNKERQLTWIVTSEKNHTISLPFTSLRLFQSQSPSVRLPGSKKKSQRTLLRAQESSPFFGNASLDVALGQFPTREFPSVGETEAAVSTKARSVGRSVRADDARLQHNAVSVRARRYEIMRGREGPRNPGRGTRAMAHSDLRRKANSRGSNQPDHPGYVALPHPAAPRPAVSLLPRPSPSVTPTGLLSAL